MSAAVAAVTPRRIRDRGLNPCPVWRESRNVAETPGWSRVLSAADRQILRSWEFEEWLRHLRMTGHKVSASAYCVVRQLIRRQDKLTGVLEVAYSYLSHMAALARSTVQIIIDKLVELGVLERQRRCMPSEDPDGPPWVQAENAYRLAVPPAFHAWREQREAERGPRGSEDFEVAAAAGAALTAAQEPEWHAQREAFEQAERQRRRQGRQIFGPGAEAFKRRLASE